MPNRLHSHNLILNKNKCEHYTRILGLKLYEKCHIQTIYYPEKYILRTTNLYRVYLKLRKIEQTF